METEQTPRAAFHHRISTAAPGHPGPPPAELAPLYRSFSCIVESKTGTIFEVLSDGCYVEGR